MSYTEDAATITCAPAGSRASTSRTRAAAAISAVSGSIAARSRHGLPAYVVGLGPVLQVWFAEKPIRNYRDAARYANHHIFRRWWEGMLERDILFHPGAFENLFVSFAHSDADIDRTLVAAGEVAGLLRAHV